MEVTMVGARMRKLGGEMDCPFLQSIVHQNYHISWNIDWCEDIEGEIECESEPKESLSYQDNSRWRNFSMQIKSAKTKQ